MHAGKLTTDSVVGKLYRILKANTGQWMGGWTLARAVFTDCISTQISGVRRQLPPHETLEKMTRTIDGKLRWFYRLVQEEEQGPVYLVKCESCRRFERHEAEWGWMGGQPAEIDCLYQQDATASREDLLEAETIWKYNLMATDCPGWQCRDDRKGEE